jgi:hypothetical protein
VDFDEPAKGSFGVGVGAPAGQPAKVTESLVWHAAPRDEAR